MLDSYEWQQLGKNDWVLGVKIRGIVREYVAEVYFAKDLNDPAGGWVWMTNKGEWTHRGLAPSLSSAISKAESSVEEMLKNNQQGD